MSPWPPILHSHPRRDALDAAANVLRNTFGHVDFRGVQPGVIGEILGGRSALAALPTGGRKSLSNPCAGPVWPRPDRFDPVP